MSSATHFAWRMKSYAICGQRRQFIMYVANLQNRRLLENTVEPQ